MVKTPGLFTKIPTIYDENSWALRRKCKGFLKKGKGKR